MLQFSAQSKLNREACRGHRDSRILLGHVALVHRLDDALNRCVILPTTLTEARSDAKKDYKPRNPGSTQEVDVSVRAIETDNAEDDSADFNSSSDEEYDDDEIEYENNKIEAEWVECALIRTPSHEIRYRDFIEGLSNSATHILEYLHDPRACV